VLAEGAEDGLADAGEVDVEAAVADLAGDEGFGGVGVGVHGGLEEEDGIDLAVAAEVWGGGDGLGDDFGAVGVADEVEAGAGRSGVAGGGGEVVDE
jgi:hypothetical protein